MVTVPAFVWRYEPASRGLILGLVVGAFLGALAWLDSGILLGGLIVFVVLGLFYGGWMTRRMLLVELFWWPKRQRQLLANADHAAARARDSAE